LPIAGNRPVKSSADGSTAPVEEFFLMPSQSVARSESIAAFIPDLERLIAEAMDEWKIPGLAIAVVQSGEVALVRAYGLRDVEAGLTVTTNTQFLIGSVTKSFTATGLALLVDERRLDWTKPVRDYIPEFRLHDAVATDRVTPRDLLRHHSGLPRHDWIWMPGDLSPAQMLTAMRYLEPSDDIRSTFQYFNLGYLVASIVTERVSGQSWTEFTRARLTDKLHMNVTFYGGGSRRNRRCRHALRDGRRHPLALETLADPRDGRGRHHHLDCELCELASPSSRHGRV
jgi:CubicO group peptidase (beta-lactamase class C family)